MTPADRLARSRLAIVEHLARRERGHDVLDRSDDPEEIGGARVRDDVRPHSRGGWLGGMTAAARAWWRNHPAQYALDFATPFLQSTMRKRPFLVLGAAAGLGAALVVARPWRVVSATTLLIGLVKSSQLSGVVMSALAGAQGWYDEQTGRVSLR